MGQTKTLDIMRTLNNNELVLLNILRSGLWNDRHSDAIISCDFSELLAIAERQSVLGVVGQVISTDKVKYDIPIELMNKVKSYMMRIYLSNEIVNEKLIKTLNFLRENNVEPILLKGQSIALFYPEPKLRMCGDIDFYVGETKYKESYTALSNIASQISDQESIFKGKDFTMLIGNVPFDIHRILGAYRIKRYNAKFQEVCAKGVLQTSEVIINNVPVSTLSETFNAFYLFHHLFNHFLITGIGLRHLCDFAVFLHARRSQINRDELYRIIDKMGLWQPWKIFGGVLVNYLGLSSADFPFYKEVPVWKLKKILIHIFEEGNFGKSTNYYSIHRYSYLYKTIIVSWYHIKRFCRMFILFPLPACRRVADVSILGWRMLVDRINKK